MSSKAWLAGTNPIKMCLFCLVSPILGIYAIYLMIFHNPEGSIYLASTICLWVALIIWQAVAGSQLNKAHQRLAPLVRERLLGDRRAEVT